jgi:hypothetical protein
LGGARKSSRCRPRERAAALVIAGLDPAIHPFREMLFQRVMDTRVKPAYDK